MTLTFPIRSDKLSMTVAVSEHLASVKSKFQQIDVYDTEVFGRVLLLDGHVQLAEFDEKAYHESLVWIPLLNLKSPKTALVVGGGDGGVIRELCKHEGLEQIDMVEIDDEVVRVCREFLPSVSEGAFDDPRVRLHIDDAFEFVRKSTMKYDLIVVDCTDVYEEEDGELSERLFTEGFYGDVKECLSPNGIVVTQADNLVYCPYSMDEVRSLYGKVFDRIGAYWGLAPSFGGFSGYVWGSRGTLVSADFPTDVGRTFSVLTPELYESGFCQLRFGRPQQ